jgi:hypothetical protein
MSTYHSNLIEYANAQFDGDSYDGPSFMKTLESLSPEAAASMETHEGYSAWEVALHVLYYKYYFIKALGAASAVEPYPYPEGHFVSPPELSQEAWSLLHSRLRAAHTASMDAVRAFPEERLDELVPGWGEPFGKGIAWLCGHDGYHAAQIRNMGVPGLKTPKEA